MNFDLTIISETIKNINQLHHQLNDILSSSVKSDNDVKNIIDKIQQKSNELRQTTYNISNEIQKEIISKCQHYYVVDHSYYDPCSTTKVCRYCKNII